MSEQYTHKTYGLAWVYLPEGNYTEEEIKEILTQFEHQRKLLAESTKEVP